MSGGTISLADVCRMLSKEYEVTVIIPERNSEQLTKLLVKYAKVIHFDGKIPEFSYYSGSNNIISKGFYSSFFVKKNDIKKIVSLIENEKTDVLIANSLVQLRMGRYLSHIKAKKFIYIRETFRENFISKCMIKYINKYFDGVLCIAPYEKRYADFERPCEVVADCIYSNSKEGGISLNKEKFNVLYMGGASLLKGFNVMLEAIEHIKLKDNITIVIAGNVQLNMPRSLKNKIIHRKELKLERNEKKLLEKYKDKIECIGFVNDIGMVMSQADVVIFPSTKPHQPRPAIEAGEYGAAVIISDYKQTSDYFINEHNCLTFEANNSKDLANKIEKLYEDKRLQEKLKKNNKDMNAKYHNFEKERDKLLSFVNRI